MRERIKLAYFEGGLDEDEQMGVLVPCEMWEWVFFELLQQFLYEVAREDFILVPRYQQSTCQQLDLQANTNRKREEDILVILFRNIEQRYILPPMSPVHLSENPP